MSKESLKSIFKTFLETTSVRGVPRAVKSSAGVMRLIWIAALASSLALTVWQLDKVFVRYYKYQSVYSMRKMFDKLIFPWVTICNESPIPIDTFQNFTWHEYIDYIEKTIKVFSLTSVDLHPILGINTQLGMTMIRWLQTQAGYIADLPVSTSPMGTDIYNSSQSNFIVDCNYFDWQLNMFEEAVVDCRKTVRVVYEHFSYRCYSFRLAENVSQNIRGFTAIFYLDDFSTIQNTYFTSDITKSQSSGIKLSVHVPGTSSDVKVGEVIGPGTEKTVHISQTNYVRLPKPYGTCINQVNFSSIDWKESSTKYAVNTCSGFCVQQIFVDNCKCVAMEFPYTELQLKQGNYMHCVNLTVINPVTVSTINWDYDMLSKYSSWIKVLQEGAASSKSEFVKNGLATQKQTTTRLTCFAPKVARTKTFPRGPLGYRVDGPKSPRAPM